VVAVALRSIVAMKNEQCPRWLFAKLSHHAVAGLLSSRTIINCMWAVGGRLGWLVTPTLLTYVSGGYTQARFNEVNYVLGTPYPDGFGARGVTRRQHLLDLL
jgi:hypothetical protein